MFYRKKVYDNLPEDPFTTIEMVYIVNPELMGHYIQIVRGRVYRSLALLEKDG